MPGVDPHIFLGEWAAPIGNARFFDSAEDRVKFGVAHVKSVVVRLEVISVVEIQRKRFVDSDRREMAHLALILKPKHASEKNGRRLLVMRRYDRVIQPDAHDRASEKTG